MKALILAFTLSLLALKPPADEIQLQYQFKTGDEFTWTQSRKQSVKQTFMGMQQEMSNNVHGEYGLKVIEATSAAAKLEVKFVKIKASSKTFIGSVIMDSEGSADVPANRMIKALIDKPFYAYMNSRGDVTNIDGLEKLHHGLNAIKTEDKEEQLMLAVLKQLVNESALKASFKEVFVVYPEEKIKIGDTWKTKMQPGLNFPMSLENTWSIAEILPANANLNADGVITTTDKNAPVEFAGIRATANLSGKQNVKLNVSLKTGMPYKQEGQADLSGSMTLLAGGMIPADMDVPVVINYKTVNIVKKKQSLPK